MPLTRSASATIRSIDETLALAHQLIDQDQASLFQSDAGSTVACRSGCTSCCHQAVPVGPAELRGLAAAITELPSEQRRRVEERISDTAERLRDLGFTADSLNELSGDERQALSERYFAADVPCPLLLDGTCATRDARPLACREYLVSSDPVHCESMPSSQVVRIRTKRDVLDGFSQIEHHMGDRGSYVLAIALAAAPPASTEQEPRSFGAVMRELSAPTRGRPAPAV